MNFKQIIDKNVLETVNLPLVSSFVHVGSGSQCFASILAMTQVCTNCRRVNLLDSTFSTLTGKPPEASKFSELLFGLPQERLEFVV